MAAVSQRGARPADAGTLRFRATVTGSNAWPMLALGVWYFLIVGFRFLLPGFVSDGVFMLVALVSGAGASFAMLVLGSGKNGALEVGPERIVLGERSVARSGLTASLSVWRQPNLFTVLGSAVTLHGDGASLVIGGRNHLVASRPDAASVERVDASLSHDDFGAFIALLGLAAGHAHDPAAAPFAETTARAPHAAMQGSDASEPRPLTIELVPSATTLRGHWHTLAPWLGGMALAGAVGFIGDALGLLRTQAGLIVIETCTVVVIAGALFLTMRNAKRRPHVRYRLVLDPPRVLLSDERAGAGFVDANVARPEATPLTYHYSPRGGRYEFPVLRLSWPSKTVVVGVWDMSLNWPKGTRRAWRLHYLVGRAEWEHLARALRLR